MTDAQFLQEVKRYVQEIDPQAEGMAVWVAGAGRCAGRFGLGFSGPDR